MSKRDLIIKGIEDGVDALYKSVPTTRTEYKDVSIDEISVVNIPKFRKKENIPDDALLSCESENLRFSWKVEVPMDDVFKRQYIITKFDEYVWSYVYTSLTENGYRRNSRNFVNYIKQDKLCEVYEKEYIDLLVDFYSLFFEMI